MSHNGIRIAASAFAAMQDARMALALSGDTQDVLLARMLEQGNDAIKDRFNEIIMMPAADIKPLHKSADEPPVLRA